MNGKLLFFHIIAVFYYVMSMSCSGKEINLSISIDTTEAQKGRGICFANIQNKEIIVCCLKEKEEYILLAYDFAGKKLDISQKELLDIPKVHSMISKIKFDDLYILKLNQDLNELVLYERHELNSNCRDVIWNASISCYTDSSVYNSYNLSRNNKYVFNEISTYAKCNIIFHIDNNEPIIFLSANNLPSNQFKVWGISGKDGKEFLFYKNTIRSKESFLRKGVWFDPTLKHIVVIGFDKTYKNLLFYSSPEDFVYDSYEKYECPNKESINFDDCYFLNSDIFVFSFDSGNMRSLRHKFHIAAFSFSQKKIILLERIDGILTHTCATWSIPWMDISNDQSRIIVAYECNRKLKVKIYYLQ